MERLWKAIERGGLIVGTLCAVVTTYFTAGLFYGWDKAPKPEATAMTAPWWLYVLGGIGAALLLTAWVMLLKRTRAEPKTITAGRNIEQPAPQTINPLETYFSKKIIRVVDLVVGAYRIEDKIFEDCVLYGPGIVGFVGAYGTVEECTLQGDPKDIFIEAENRRIQGAIGFSRCVFRRCRFIGLGIVGAPALIQEFMANTTMRADFD